MTMKSIKKRDGRTVAFDASKIEAAIMKAFEASGSAKGQETAEQLTQRVIEELENNESIGSVPTVEEVQDTVERVLIEKGFVRSAKAYILYRAERSQRCIRDSCYPAGRTGARWSPGWSRIPAC